MVIPPAQPAMPTQATQEPVAPQTPTPQAQPTEHTARLLQGERVEPFDGIEPNPEHVSAELQFIASDQFTQLPEEIQAIYAEHALKEKQILEGNQQPIIANQGVA